MFAALNALLIPVVYLFFPETAGRSLEGASKRACNLKSGILTTNALKDMDVIFALAYKEGVSPVKVSLRKDIPSAGTPEADEILGMKLSNKEDTRDDREKE